MRVREALILARIITRETEYVAAAEEWTGQPEDDWFVYVRDGISGNHYLDLNTATLKAALLLRVLSAEALEKLAFPAEAE